MFAEVNFLFIFFYPLLFFSNCILHNIFPLSAFVAWGSKKKTFRNVIMHINIIVSCFQPEDSKQRWCKYKHYLNTVFSAVYYLYLNHLIVIFGFAIFVGFLAGSYKFETSELIYQYFFRLRFWHSNCPESRNIDRNVSQSHKAWCISIANPLDTLITS